MFALGLRSVEEINWVPVIELSPSGLDPGWEEEVVFGYRLDTVFGSTIDLFELHSHATLL